MQLEQSPFLNIYSDDRVREALKFMGRAPGERLTKDLAREICQRQGLKALLAGSISNLGGHYVVTLEAVNAQTGDAIAREQAEADGKERVLGALGAAATRLREKLGESLPSIQKFDAPIEQVTTTSLDALKAYTLGAEQRTSGRFGGAIPFFKHAVELDPNFARAYVSLSIMYSNIGQLDQALEAEQKAYDLRARVSERERFGIEQIYYFVVTNELDKSAEVTELWKRTYPRDQTPFNNLSYLYGSLGQFDKAIENGREALRLNPNYAAAYGNVAYAFLYLNRLEEAKAIAEEALARKLDNPGIRFPLYSVAFIRGDAAAMQQQVDALKGKPGEHSALDWQAQAAGFGGQLRKAREFRSQAANSAQARGLKEPAAASVMGGGRAEGLFGNCPQAKDAVAKALALSRATDTLRAGAKVLASCGDARQAQTLIEEAAKRNPKDSRIPADRQRVQALSELHRGNYAQALELLRPTIHDAIYYEVPYFRGQAYLGQKSGAEAAAEFRRILDRRGFGPMAVYYPLAQLGLARAAALQGDTTRARQAYQDFFALWKDADPDIPVLQAARQEYEKLK